MNFMNSLMETTLNGNINPQISLQCSYSNLVLRVIHCEFAFHGHHFMQCHLSAHQPLVLQETVALQF